MHSQVECHDLLAIAGVQRRADKRGDSPGDGVEDLHLCQNLHLLRADTGQSQLTAFGQNDKLAVGVEERRLAETSVSSVPMSAVMRTSHIGWNGWLLSAMAHVLL